MATLGGRALLLRAGRLRVLLRCLVPLLLLVLHRKAYGGGTLIAMSLRRMMRKRVGMNLKERG